MIAPLTSMLKITGLSNKPAPSRNNSCKWAFNKNDNSKSTFGRNDGNSEINWIGVGRNGMEYAKKSGILSKLGNLKSKKMSKSQKLSKLRKSKSEKTSKS